MQPAQPVTLASLSALMLTDQFSPVTFSQFSQPQAAQLPTLLQHRSHSLS
jgi:hypothetical protein